MTGNVPFFAFVAGQVRRFLADEDGATAIEYALLASCIAVAIVSTLHALGSNLRDNFYQKIVNAFPS
jgi:pilus assembly protein Flp/PilA